MATPVIMPKLEMTQEEATVVTWIKQEGEHVEKGEPLLTIETDKVTMDVESPGTGVLAGICAAPDQVVPVTQVIAYVLQPGEPLPHGASASSMLPLVSPTQARTQGTRQRAATPVAERMAAEHGLDLGTVAGTGPGGRITKGDVETALTSAAQAPDRVRATPAARRIARECDIDLVEVDGSGPRGRVQASDVLAYAPWPTAVPKPEAETVSLRGMRRKIAERMQYSYQTAPHITLTVEADMSAAEALRRELNERAAALDVPRISVTAVLVKVCAWALQRHRWVNASLDGDQIHLHEASNVGVAVALDEGLIVPVIREAEKLGIAEISSRVRDLAQRARQNALTPSDVTGGTFTITNLGMFDIDHFAAIINPPESAILAVGRIVKRPRVVERDGQDVVEIRPMANLTLSADHRVLDGAVAARFLRDVVGALECPNLLLW
jgi:pyruvate dehydrogenase E2 component (dihydrolipoamide acetyltransferase)